MMAENGWNAGEAIALGMSEAGDQMLGTLYDLGNNYGQAGMDIANSLGDAMQFDIVWIEADANSDIA
jgi:hypothetical protein